MRILATGPPSSGTRYLTALLAAGGADVVHLSQPDQRTLIEAEGLLAKQSCSPFDLDSAWFDPVKAVRCFDAVVIVLRGRVAHSGSYLTHWKGMTVEQALEWRKESLRRLAPIMGRDTVTVVTYESLAVREERIGLLAELGLDVAGADRERWVNMNRKHYEIGPPPRFYLPRAWP